MNRGPLLFLASLLVWVGSAQAAEPDWASEYGRLNENITKRYADPRGNPTDIDSYIRPLYEKGADRNQTEDLARQARALADADPQNQEMRQWAAEFEALADLAQTSGDQTTLRAMSYMKVVGRGWKQQVFNAKELRKLLKAASENQFLPERVREFAHCMMRYASRDIDCSEAGLGLYRGCTLPMPDWVDMTDGLSFNERCPNRQTPFSKDKPQLPCEDGLEAAEEIRDECAWWDFWAEHSVVTDIMESYYEDVLCDWPPQGHRWYEKQAEKYSLGEAIRHNHGFYGTLVGKVEADFGAGKTPVEGAKVRLYAPKDKEEWTDVTDSEGKYKIEEAILHKRCSPFDLSAKYKGQETKKSFEGPLEEPDPGHEHEENLVLELEGRIELRRSVTSVYTGVSMSHQVRGTVPFKIDVDEEPPRVTGEGSVSYTGSGTAGPCTYSQQAQPPVEINGWLEDRGEDMPPLLKIHWSEEWGGGSGTVSCPGVTTPLSRPADPPLHDDRPKLLEFSLEDGHEVRLAFRLPGHQFMKGTSTYVLHLWKE